MTTRSKRWRTLLVLGAVLLIALGTLRLHAHALPNMPPASGDAGVAALVASADAPAGCPMDCGAEQVCPGCGMFFTAALAPSAAERPTAVLAGTAIERLPAERYYSPPQRPPDFPRALSR